MVLSSKEASVGNNDQKDSRDCLLNKIRIVRWREKDIVEAYVLPEVIYDEDVPVDNGHVQNLKVSILKEEASGKENGQLSALLLGQLNNCMYLKVLDGFHRYKALKELGKNEILSTIRLNCTEGDVLDHRIIAAVSHKSVNFVRTVEWSTQAWNLSPWGKKLKLTEAFDLRFSERRTKAGITKEDVTDIKKWIDDKCSVWGVHAPTLHQYLIIAETADPQLVKSVRFRAGGSGGLKALTVNHLKEIVKLLQGNFEFQNIVAAEVLRKELHVPQAKELTKAVSKVNSAEEANEIVKSGSWKEAKEQGIPIEIPVQKEEFINGRGLADELFSAEKRIAKILMVTAGFKEKANSNQITDEKVLQLIRKVVLNLPTDFRSVFILLKEYGLSKKDVGIIFKKTEQDIIKTENLISDTIRKTDPELASLLSQLKPKLSLGQISENNTSEPNVIFKRPVAKTEISKKTVSSKVNQEEKPRNDIALGGYISAQRQESKNPTVPLPEHPEREPEDFKNGQQVWFIKAKEGDKPGTIIGVGYDGIKYYVKIEIPNMRHRGITEYVAKIPVTQFDNVYTLNKT